MISQSVAWYFLNLPFKFKETFLSGLINFGLVNVALWVCVVAERYIRYTWDLRMWRYGITVIADVALHCKLILAYGVRINPGQGFNWIFRQALHAL
jgi:hypothetical protein